MKRATVAIIFGLFLVPAVSQAQVESQGYVLDQPSFNYGSGTTSSSSHELSGGVGPGGPLESESLLVQLGQVEAAVLPTPPRPIATILSPDTLWIVVDVSRQEKYPQTQVRGRRINGGTDFIYLNGSGQPEDEAAAWLPAAIWQEGVKISGLTPGATYVIDARVKGELASVSEWSNPVSVTMSLGGMQGILPPAVVEAINRWLHTPLGEAIGDLADRLTSPLAVAAAAIQLTVASTLFGQLLLDLLARLATGISPLLQLAALYRKRSHYGEVFDGPRRQPVAGARVTLLRADTKTTIEQQVSDAQGRFFFTQNDQATYLLRVEAVGFDLYERVARAKQLNHRVMLGIPLEQDARRLRRHRAVDRTFAILNVWRAPILVLGTALWLILYLRDGGALIWFGYYYVAAWLIEVIVRLQPSPYGIVTDQLSGQPLGSAVIRFIDARGRLAVTYVTSANGRFSTLLRVGAYQIKITKSGYQPTLLPRVRLTRRGTAQGLRVLLRRLGGG